INIALACEGDGKAESSIAAMVQLFSWMSRACEALNSSIAQKMGSQRCSSGDEMLARCAELTTSTAWNLCPTEGRGCTLRTPASCSAAKTSRYEAPALILPATASSTLSRDVSSI